MKKINLIIITTIIIVLLIVLVVILYPKENKVNKTIYTVNTYDEKVQGNNKILIGQEVPEEIKQYDTNEEARANFSNRLFYLKHKIKNGKVKDSYVEFIVTLDIVDNNPGMTSGTYTLKGYDGDYNSNKDELLNSFGENYCKENKTYMHCKIDGLYANAFKNGYVEVGTDYWNCYVTDKGASRCDFGK